MRRLPALACLTALCAACPAPIANDAAEGEGEDEGEEGEGEGGDPRLALRLNEVGCSDDFIELIATGGAISDTAGVVVSDRDVVDDRAVPLDAATIAAGALVTVVPATFGIACDETITLFVDGVVVDTLTPGGGGPLGAAGRVPDGSGPVTPTTPTPGAPNVAASDPSEVLFDVFAAPFELAIVVGEASEQSLRDDGYTYVEGTVQVRAGDVDTGPLVVGLRKKGRIGSFRDFDGKMAWKIDTNRFVVGQKLLGLEKLNLNNLVQDPSSVHEYMAYEVFRAVAVAAPRLGYAHVTVNGDDAGTYLVVEATDDDVFLERHFAGTTGLFEGEYGQDLFPGSGADFDQDDGGPEAVLALDELAARLDSAGDDVLAALDPILDWDQVLATIATEIFIGHWDGYGPTRNNYFLHLGNDGRWSLLPWGVDQTFDYPWPLYDGQGLILQRCLADAACRQRYEAAMLAVVDAVDALRAAGFDDDVRALAAANVARFADDPRREWNHEDIPALAEAALAFLDARSQAVRDELACTQDPDADVDGDGFACSLDCNEGDPGIFFGATEVCGNDVDEDCSGRFDDADHCPDCLPDTSDPARPLLICRVGRIYADAVARCAEDGMRLVAITSAEDNEAVYARARRRLGDQAYWIGLDDTAVEGRYDFSDGRSWTPESVDVFAAWAAGEPNDAGDNEDCGHVWGFISEWNDIPCDGAAFAAVCEPLP
jgi:hypothetical protein